MELKEHLERRCWTGTNASKKRVAAQVVCTRHVEYQPDFLVQHVFSLQRPLFTHCPEEISFDMHWFFSSSGAGRPKLDPSAAT